MDTEVLETNEIVVVETVLSDEPIFHYTIDYTNEELYNKIKKVTASDIKNFIDRLILDTVYFLKEEEHE